VEADDIWIRRGVLECSRDQERGKDAAGSLPDKSLVVKKEILLPAKKSREGFDINTELR
jgi:hypothetical protein